ncbi:uncharacterized protein LOC129942742 [Eupeodes corollae]|uniref:uncharacterized protein LOC129942742 n=1 Tax=Eupeodes corollae TaxID=290404 RepID=UPI0024916536|nr:uncharacterized protein LOC129942742 [Eupeodes corollae]
MARIESGSAILNDQLDYNYKNYLNDGLADDDSWMENASQNEEDFKEFDHIADDHIPPLSNIDDSSDESVNSCQAIDFTLHTIAEESCEDSEFDLNKCKDKYGYPNTKNDVSPTYMEQYFVFGFDDRNTSGNCLEDSSSEIFSDFSDIVEQEPKETNNDIYVQKQSDLPKSRLEKYFLSEFMGFCVENKSDSSVGSDSEGKPTPNQRKKKLRTRRTPRSNYSSLDNLLVECAEHVEQSIESPESSESDVDVFPNEVVICDKLDNIHSVKRKKNYRKRELVELTTSTSSAECGKLSKSLISELLPNKSVGNLKNYQVLFNSNKRSDLRKNQFTKLETSYNRADSFNNWSSDEETNIMMSKMRHFFKTLIAVKTNNANLNSSSPNKDPIVICKPKFIPFPYFESELIRLMKTVPGMNNQQLKEIVEYLSSEETWSDSNDSSDFNTSNIDIVYKDKKHSQYSAQCNCKDDSIQNVSQDNRICFIGPETVLIYTNLFKSFMLKSSKMAKTKILEVNKYDDHLSKSLKTEQLLENIWQHIGQKLVDLMREDNINTDCVTKQNIEEITEICKLNVVKSQNENILNNMDNSAIIESQQPAFSPRSKSHDTLLGTSRSWHSYSNSAVNDNSSETSDCDRFSWRGSFESALLAPGDSRYKLPNYRDNGFRISHLDRVQSCGSILSSEKSKCLEIQKKWLSTCLCNKLDKETSFRRLLQKKMCTNSLPGLQSKKNAANSEFDLSEVQSSVKSARYRSPAIQSNNPLALTTSTRNQNKTQGETQHLNCSNKHISTSSCFGKVSTSDPNCKPNTSPSVKQKIVSQINTTNCEGRTEQTSVCPDNPTENVKVKGQVEFGMQYNYKINALEILVVQCKDLASVSSNKCKSDPYVKVYVLPDLSKCAKRKTKVKKQTLNPVFNETLRFHIPISKLNKSSIWLSVWNSDFLGKNDFLGEVILDLRDKVFDKPQSEWYTLHQKSPIFDDDSKYRGHLIVALKFMPREMHIESNSKIENTNAFIKGKLCILVKEAKYLYAHKNSGTSDTFCKSYLLPDRTKSTKQKTHVIKKSFNPVWNFTFVYENLTINELSTRALELTVWDHDSLISNQFIGGVRFSLGSGANSGNELIWMDSNEKEISLWREMMNRPNFWIEGSVKLRSNLNEILDRNDSRLSV